MTSDFWLKPGCFQYYVMRLWILFKLYVFVGFWNGACVTSLLPYGSRCPGSLFGLHGHPRRCSPELLSRGEISGSSVGLHECLPVWEVGRPATAPHMVPTHTAGMGQVGGGVTAWLGSKSWLHTWPSLTLTLWRDWGAWGASLQPGEGGSLSLCWCGYGCGVATMFSVVFGWSTAIFV